MPFRVTLLRFNIADEPSYHADLEETLNELEDVLSSGLDEDDEVTVTWVDDIPYIVGVN